VAGAKRSEYGRPDTSKMYISFVYLEGRNIIRKVRNCSLRFSMNMEKFKDKYDHRVLDLKTTRCQRNKRLLEG
jgi:hypothetical protein